MGRSRQKNSIIGQFGAGVRAGLQNPRLAIAYGAAFIGRGDLVIIGNFFMLWITQYGIAQGLSTAEASGKAFMLFGIVQVAALGWAFFMGMIADRLNRLTALCIALALATVAYSLVGQVTDPFAGSMIPVAILLGIGEVSVIVGGGALLGQEAQSSLRGAIVGVFSLMGGVGIIIVSGVGGVIFDSVGRTAPFTMMGIVNGLLLILALVTRLRAGEPARSTGSPAQDMIK
jgi:MFS family permease